MFQSYTKSELNINVIKLIFSEYHNNRLRFVYRIFENIGVKSGLIGCIHSMKIGRYSVNLLGFEDSDLVIKSEGVTECQKSCTNGTCGCLGNFNRILQIYTNDIQYYIILTPKTFLSTYYR